MNILHVCSYLYPALSFGGPAKVVYDLAVEQSKNDFVTVYTTDVWDKKSRMKRKDRLQNIKNLSVLYFPNIINEWAFSFRFFTSFTMPIQFILDRRSFSLVHIHDVFIIPQLLVGYLALLFHIPLFISPHGVLDPVRMERKSAVKSLFLFCITPLFSRAHALIATSDKEKKDLLTLGFSRVHRVWNGVPSVEPIQGKEFRRLRNTKGKNWLYIGKLHPQKGLRELVNAFLSVGPQEDQLILAGPDDGIGEELQKIVQRNKRKNIKIIGFVDERQKKELFYITHIFIYPSYAEGFSISILEALSAGLPVVITKQCNFPAVQTHKAGIVVNAINLEENLKKTIAACRIHPSFDGEQKNSSRELFEKYFTIGKMSAAMKDIYTKCM